MGIIDRLLEMAAQMPPAPPIVPPSAPEWSCFTCGYRGDEADFSTTKEGACPECGTQSGDGFGMAENEHRKPASQPAAPPPARPYYVRYLMGRCANGAERDTGRLLHAVKGATALCGKSYGRQSAGWSEHQDGAAVTCPKCAKKIAVAPL